MKQLTAQQARRNAYDYYESSISFTLELISKASKDGYTNMTVEMLADAIVYKLVELGYTVELVTGLKHRVSW